MDTNDSDRVQLKQELVFVLGYFALYVGYLFVHREGEFAHWVSLVLFPGVG